MRAGELPDELGEILAADGAQQRVGEVVEVHARVVEVERFDSPVGQKMVVKPSKQARLAGAVVAEDHEHLRIGRVSAGVDEIVQPVRESGRRRDRDADRGAGRGGFERVEGEFEPGQDVRHDGFVHGGRRR